ncbi:MAG: D-alanyl-D-alanine carboxypeptidase, partial [Clostridia bacterium]|nr:D-alanyl-D-alanine carboxypeptidase [Clostridia bacterium]
MLALAALLIFCIVQEKNFQEGPVYDYERYYGRVIINKSEVENLPGDDLSLYASASVAIDYRDGHILYGDEENIQLPMASTTKILTAIIALENASGDEIVTISKNAANSPKVRLGVKEGEQYYLKDLLLSMMLGSHNDSAVAIAEHLAGSTEAFSKMMNEKAHEIGVKNSSFVTPNGLDAENHYSTAYDMAVIGSYAIQNDEFVKLINTSQHSFSEINNKSSHNVTNINSYLSIDDTAIGIKTGFTGKAGYCFVGANTYEDTIVVSCVLACGWPP